jgi:hypothetical protein
VWWNWEQQNDWKKGKSIKKKGKSITSEHHCRRGRKYKQYRSP